MAPDHQSHRHDTDRKTPAYATTPQRRGVQSGFRRDFHVTVQVGAFVAVLVTGVILWLNPEAVEAAALAAALTITATRRSHLRYRHQRAR
jgi:Flp pilus assembly protein TadB